MSVNIRMEGLAELLRNIEQFPKKLQRRILNGALKDAAKPITDATRKLAPKRTGALRRSIRPTTVRAGRIGPVMLINVGIRRKVVNRRKGISRNEDAFYAKFVEFGAGKHPIVATKKMLKFNNKFFRRVQHPGTKRQEFFTRSIDSNAPAATGIFVRQVRERLAQVRSASYL